MITFAVRKRTLPKVEKKERHSILLKIVREHGISDQRALQAALEAKGVAVTQATLSRDLKALHVVKHPTANGYVYAVGGEDRNAQKQEKEEEVAFSGNLAVIKTRPGYAAAKASEIDSKHSRWILGTIAGDDTVLVVLKEGANKTEVEEEVRTMNGEQRGVEN